MIQFDEQSFMKPYTIQNLNLNDFELCFSTNQHRKSLFDEYSIFLDKLKSLEIENFYQWIDGSFVTQKNFPGDIDVVTFIDTTIYRKIEKELLLLPRLFENIDCYFVEVYPKDSKKFFITQTDESYWFHLFQGTRKPRVKEGFVQIIFNHGN
jgi:hypothetical protein